MNEDFYYTQFCDFINDIEEEYSDYKIYRIFESLLDVYSEDFGEMTEEELRKNTIIYILLDECFDRLDIQYIDPAGTDNITYIKIKVKKPLEPYKVKLYYDKYVESWEFLCEYSNK